MDDAKLALAARLEEISMLAKQLPAELIKY